MTLDNFISTILMTQCQEDLESLYQSRSLTPNETKENLVKIRGVFENGIAITEDQIFKLITEKDENETESTFRMILRQLILKLELESILNYRMDLDMEELEDNADISKELQEHYDLLNSEIRIRQFMLIEIGNKIQSKLSPNTVAEL